MFGPDLRGSEVNPGVVFPEAPLPGPDPLAGEDAPRGGYVALPSASLEGVTPSSGLTDYEVGGDGSAVPFGSADRPDHGWDAPRGGTF
jgi:hypothetical protein